MKDETHRFWAFCSDCGVVSKRLAVNQFSNPASPIGITVCEAVKYGAPIITVPYNSSLNGQTLRGGVVPRSLPPIHKMVQFLCRRNRMGVLTAQCLWLAAFLACYRQQWKTIGEAEHYPLSPLFSRLTQPTLPSPFQPQNAAFCAALHEVHADELKQIEQRTVAEVDLTYYMLQYYTKRRGVAAKLRPSRENLMNCYQTVLYRSLLLPANGEPSAPAALSELVEASPDLPLLPSLVPVIDMIRAASCCEKVDGKKKEPNCTLYTCVESDFISESSRRRVIIETEPLSAHRVVVCATTNLQEGDELLLDFE